MALADLGGCWDLDAVVQALSAFADASVSAATDALLRQGMAAGRFRPQDPEAPQVGSGLVVLALGKHGGAELNYSSDIDLIVFYEAERAAAATGGDPKAFFVKLAQGLVKLLSERTADGYVHRIDYRLRPDPGSTAVALSTGFAFDYYQTLGQNWERAAFIKARPIAGDIPAGAAFLADLAPFIWRRHFDFAAIAEIHAMKRQIHMVRGHDTITVAGHDIKIGRGGIREIEFFVQTQQLVFGGRKPALRGRRTVEMLGRLVEEGWIDAQARDELTAAYGFLRTLEHRIQMIRDEQTQRLPTGDAALDALARFAGFDTRGDFETALLHHAGRVQAHYALLFETAPGDGAPEDSLVFGESEPDPTTLEALAAFGFRDPRLAWETVQAGMSAAVRRSRPAGRGRSWPSYCRASCGRSAGPPIRTRPCSPSTGPSPGCPRWRSSWPSCARTSACASCSRTSWGPRPISPTRSASAPTSSTRCSTPISWRRRRAPTRCATSTGRWSGSRRATRSFWTAAGTQPGRWPSSRRAPPVRPDHAASGRGGLFGPRGGHGRAEPRSGGAPFAQDHGAVPKGRCCVLALGRLGSRQLSAVSDLDLVFLYDFDPDDRMTDGPRPLDAVVAYNRLAQRLYAALTTATRRGRLYAVDLRLRPYGSHSPPAVQLNGFVTYQREAAEPWEHMALTRARVVAGDPALGAASWRRSPRPSGSRAIPRRSVPRPERCAGSSPRSAAMPVPTTSSSPPAGCSTSTSWPSPSC